MWQKTAFGVTSQGQVTHNNWYTLYRVYIKSEYRNRWPKTLQHANSVKFIIETIQLLISTT